MNKLKAFQVSNLLTKATHELTAAERLMSGYMPLPDTAAYHCYRSAAEALTAYLIFADYPYQKNQNLRSLFEHCQDLDGSFRQIKAAVDALSPFETLLNVDNAPEVDITQSAGASRLSVRVLDFVNAKISEDKTIQQAGDSLSITDRPTAHEKRTRVRRRMKRKKSLKIRPFDIKNRVNQVFIILAIILGLIASYKIYTKMQAEHAPGQWKSEE